MKCSAPGQLTALLQGWAGNVTLVLCEVGFNFEDFNFRVFQAPAQRAVLDAWHRAAQETDASFTLSGPVDHLVVWAAPVSATWLGALPPSVHLAAVRVYERGSTESSNVVAACPESLGELRLDSQRMTMLPDSMGQLAALTTLDLRYCNKLTGLPKWIGHLTALTTLDLRSCESLTGLPELMGQLPALIMLNLSSCRSLTKLPESMGQLTALETLNLSYCTWLTGLPESMG